MKAEILGQDGPGDVHAEILAGRVDLTVAAVCNLDVDREGKSILS